MFFQASPCDFISFCRAAIASSAVIFGCACIDAQPTAAIETSAAAVTIRVRRVMSPPRLRGSESRGFTTGTLLRNDDLVPDRRKRFQILCDRDPVSLGE